MAPSGDDLVAKSHWLMRGSRWRAPSPGPLCAVEWRGAHPSARSEVALDFPLAELMDEDACYAKLLHRLHPDGLACPRCGARDGLGVHRRHRVPILDYRCTACRRDFNAFTGTVLQGSRRPVVALMLILRGFAQG